MRDLLRSLVPLALCAAAAGAASAEDGAAAPAARSPAAPPADAPVPPALVFLGLNPQGAEEWWRPADGAVVIRVPAGEYLRRPYEGTVATADPEPFAVGSFLIDKYEVTNARFAAFLNAGGAAPGVVREGVAGLAKGADGRWAASPGREDHPVTAATGTGALAYAKWVGGRIPTQPEWEKAAGGAEGRLWPWGDEPPDEARANFGRPAPRGLEPVGSHPLGASPYGCLDMAGNAYDRVLARARDGSMLPVMVKGGSWLSPHPLNLRVLDLCMQSAEVADASVGFRCAMDDPEPARPTRTAEAPPVLRLARDFDAAVAEAKQRRVPIFLSLLHDTCGQCDRTREQLYRDPRFVRWCNENAVVVVGHYPGDALDDPHAPGEGGACPLYPGVTCAEHEALYGRGLAVVTTFAVTPGNFVLHPDRVRKGAGAEAVLVPEQRLPKWGAAVDEYLRAFEAARRKMAEEAPR